MKYRAFVAAAAAVLLPTVASAEPGGYGGVGLNLGTTGFGIDYRYGINRFVDVRAGYQGGSVSHNYNKDGNDFDGKLKIHTGELLADIKPFGGGFRITTGLYTGAPSLRIRGKGNGPQQFTFNNTDYNTDVNVHGNLSLGHTAPYLGVGWGGTTNGSGFGVTFDMGVMFASSPKVSLDAHGKACDASVNPTCDPNGAEGFDVDSSDPRATQFQSDKTKEQAKLEDDSKDFKYWPVINLGMVYRF